MTLQEAIATLRSYVGEGWDETKGVSWTSWDEAHRALETLDAEHKGGGAAFEALDGLADWFGFNKTPINMLREQHERMIDVLLNCQGCRTCDMCPDCGHLAHGAAKDIGHYEECEIEEVLALCRPSA